MRGIKNYSFLLIDNDNHNNVFKSKSDRSHQTVENNLLNIIYCSNNISLNITHT